MSHAIAGMARALRAHPGELGLIYGQGGYLNKHHALIVRTNPPPAPRATDYSVQALADAARGPVPPLAENYAGPVTIETYTVPYARDGAPLSGIVIARTPDGARVMARTPAEDHATIEALTSLSKSAIGADGYVQIDVFGKPTFNLGKEPRRRERKGCLVEKDGHLTIVTISRPDSMNALDPDTNAELAEIFDDFAADPEQWVVILTGAGDRAFSSGNDLKEIADHFRGFAGYWEVPGKAKTAEIGRWVRGPGKEIFQVIRQSLGVLPIIAEDLGVITADVEKLRDDLGYPGMKILQFSFEGNPKDPFLPHNYPGHCVVYTGTHDNDTARGWFERVSEEKRDFCRRYLNSDGSNVAWDMIRAAWASVAAMALAHMQDFLNLGNEARMNFPGNAQWQLDLAHDR